MHLEEYDDVKSKAKRGVLWNIFGTYGNMIVTGATTVVLARVLGPEVYGALFSVMIFIGFVPILVNLGFEQALIAFDDVTDEEFDSSFTLVFLLSVVYTLLLSMTLPYFIDTYTNVEEVNIVYGLSFLVIVNGTAIVPRAILGKKLGFESLNKALVFATPIPGVVAIVMAITGFGIWSLVIQQLLVALFKSSLYFYFSKWRPSFKLNLSVLSRYRKFCTNLFLDQSLFYLAKNMDGAIIAAVFSTATVGLYSKAIDTLRRPVTQVNTIFLSVLFPSLSRIRSNQLLLNETCEKLVQIIAFTVFPAVAVIGLLSKEIVLLVFGVAWLGMIPYMKIFALGVAIIPLTYVGTNAILAMGETKLLLRSNLIYRALLISMFGLLFMLQVEAIWYAGIVSLGFYLQYLITIKYLNDLGGNVIQLNLPLIWRSLLLTCLSFIVGTAVYTLFEGHRNFVIIGGVGSTYGLLYFLGSIWLNRKPMLMLLDNLPNKLRGKKIFVLVRKIYSYDQRSN